MDIPKELVVCLQRCPSREVLITFIDKDTKSLFVRYVAVCFHDSVSAINNEDMHLTFLTVYDTPHELPDEALSLRLSKYCEVNSSRRGKYSKSRL